MPIFTFEVMALILLAFFLAVIGFLVYKEKTGAVLCMLTLFPDVVGVVLNNVGLMGLNMAVKYALFACVLWSSRLIINQNWSNLFRNPLSVMLYILILVMLWHNEIYIGTAKTNASVAEMQLNIFLRILIPYIILILCADQEDVLDQYCKAIPWWGFFQLISFVILFGFGSVNFSDRATLTKGLGINSITLSRYAVITLLGALVSLMRTKDRLQKYAYSIILGVGTFMLLLASQRGTIIGGALAALICMGLILIRQGRTKQFVFITAGVGAAVTILLTCFDFEILNRFNQFENMRSFERYYDYGISWHIFQENDYLTGLGTKGYYLYTNGVRTYPHNMVLEFMVEYGLVGLVIALFFIIYGVYMSYKILLNYRKVNIEMAVPIIWIAMLCSVMVSGNIVRNASFFLISGALTLCYQNIKTEENAEEPGEQIENPVAEA